MRGSCDPHHAYRTAQFSPSFSGRTRGLSRKSHRRAAAAGRRHAEPRRNPSGETEAVGRALDAHFVDIAAAAGLTAPVVWPASIARSSSSRPTVVAARSSTTTTTAGSTFFLLSGTRLEGAPPGATNRLDRNNRDGTFTDVTKQAGSKTWAGPTTVCVGDYNNDGHDDLFCTYFGQNKLYRNMGRR